MDRFPLLSLIALLLFAGCSSDSPPGDPSAGDATKSSDTTATSGPPESGSEVLRRMAKAYQSAQRYADRGTIHVYIEQGDQKHDETSPFRMALQRPDKLRLEVEQMRLVIDGRELIASVDALPDQVVERDAPEQLTLGSLDHNPALVSAFGDGFASTSVRLVLLLADDPLSILLAGADEPKLEESGEWAGRACYRVSLRREGQEATYWIDQEDYVLRRIDLPPAGLIDQFSAQGPVQSASVRADFGGARLDGDIPAEAFEFAVPEGTRRVAFFQPPGPADLLGEPAPDFSFARLDGDPVTRASAEGKVVVLDFWATHCGPCRTSLPKLNTVRQQYAENDKVAIYAVSVDTPEVDDAALRAMFEELKVEIPILRDTQAQSATEFNVSAIPTMFVLGPNGLVQHFEMGANPNLTEQLPKLIDRLLAGESTFEDARREHEEQLKRYEQMLEQVEAGAGAPPPTEIAEPTEPQALKLESAWTVDQLKEPGNVLPFNRDGEPRLAVIDGWTQIAELKLDGTVVDVHEVEMAEGEAFNTLRTTTDADGNRLFVTLGMLMGQQRVHLLDAAFTKQMSFPENALESPHAGIGDVQFGSLVGDPQPHLLIGYWGEVGVQAVSLAGERIWSNRKVTEVQRLALTGPDAAGERQLLCATAKTALGVIDADGHDQPPLSLPGRMIAWIASADLDADGAWAYCGLLGGEVGRNEAIGIRLENGQAEETWSYRLPDGVAAQPIEPIIPGRLDPDGPGVWLLPGPDGSIHIVQPDGTVVERFNYGAGLRGLATARDGSRTLLIVASEGKVEALAVGR